MSLLVQLTRSRYLKLARQVSLLVSSRTCYGYRGIYTRQSWLCHSASSQLHKTSKNITNPGKYVQTLSCYSTVAQSELSAVESLCSATVPNELLNSVCELQAELEPHEVWRIVRNLKDSVYAHLGTEIAWLGSSIGQAYVQLVLNNVLEKHLTPFNSHEGFNILLDRVGDSYSSMETLHLYETLHNFLLLDVVREHPTVHKLIFESTKHVAETDIFGLHSLLQSMRIFRRQSSILDKPVMNRIIALISEDKDWTVEELKSLSWVILIAWGTTSQETIDRILKLINQEIIKQEDVILSDPEAVKIFLRLLGQQRGQQGQNKSFRADSARISNIILRKVRISILKILDKLSPKDIGSICIGLKHGRMFPKTGEFADKVKKRSLELAKKTDNLNDLVSLAQTLAFETKRETKSYIEKKICNKLDDADVTLLSQLAFYLTHMFVVESYGPLNLKFQEKVLENFDMFVSYYTRLNYLTNYLVRQGFRNQELAAKFNTKLMEYLDSQVWTGRLCNICACFLLSSQDELPQKVMDIIVNNLPQWSPKRILTIARALQEMPPPTSPAKAHQMYQLEGYLNSIVLHKVETAQTIMDLDMLVHAFVVYEPRRDPTLAHTMFNAYLPFLDTRCSASAITVINTVSVYPLVHHLPDLFTRLVDCVLAHPNNFDGDHICILLGVMAKAGFKPNNFNRFLPHVVSAYKSVLTSDPQTSVGDRIRILFHLSLLEVYPEELLKDVFAIDFIERVDEFLSQENVLIGNNTAHELMLLNRALVLENACPQLEVPWFHEDYADKTKRFIGARMINFQNEVEKVLAEVVGGRKFLRRDASNSYHHYNNFEVILDEFKQPVAMGDVDITLPEDWTRVAVLTQIEHAYCFNSTMHTGRTKALMRQLNLLDYNVVEIPWRIWHSMGMATSSAKKQYVRELIME